MTATLTPASGPALISGPEAGTTSARTSVARPAQEVRAAGGEAGARTSNPLVVGLDLSLVATGVAHVTSSGHVEDVVTAAGRDIVRLRRLAHQVKQLVSSADLVVLEGPAYSRQGQKGHHEGAGLWWLVRDRLLVAGKPVAIVPPNMVKGYALGKASGKGTDKAAVIVAARERLGYTGTENNEADALWLATMGHAWLTGEHPVPQAHRKALDSCAWPT